MIELTEHGEYTNRDLSIFDANMALPRHRWFQFKEGFSASLVDKAITAFETENGRRPTLLDPFSGSGTTLVAAASHGLKATGVEVNPFLAFATKAKTVRGGWRRRPFEDALATVVRESRDETPSRLEGVSTFTERPGTEKWLFNRSVLRGFSAIDAALRSSTYAIPLRLALLSSVMDCCNAKRDGKCLRYKSDWKTLGFNSGDVRKRFVVRARQMFEDAQITPFSPVGLKLERGDTRAILPRLRRIHDVLVTSPPYLNSFDYSDMYRPELFVGRFVRDNGQLRTIRLSTVRSHVQADWARAASVVSPILRPILDRLNDSDSLWDPRLPEMVKAYFEDMKSVLSASARIVRPGGDAWIVVSTSAYAGVEIPVDLIIADLATRCGWDLVAVHVLRALRSAGQQWKEFASGTKPPLRESLIKLKRRKMLPKK
jgi:DNA modification methylase